MWYSLIFLLLVLGDINYDFRKHEVAIWSNENINVQSIWEETMSDCYQLAFGCSYGVEQRHAQVIRGSFQKCLYALNTLKPRKDYSHFADDIFKWIFLNEIIWILIKVSYKVFPFLAVQLTIFQHWFRWWLGADQATVIIWTNDS